MGIANALKKVGDALGEVVDEVKNTASEQIDQVSTSVKETLNKEPEEERVNVIIDGTQYMNVTHKQVYMFVKEKGLLIEIDENGKEIK